MENIYAIAISDFQEKIHFLHIKPHYNHEEAIKIVKSLNKQIGVNYLQEFITKNFECKFIDSNVNSSLKVKISMLGEIIIHVLYESYIDIYFINIVNQRLIEAVFNLTKMKKVKIEFLNKKYLETCSIIDDTMYMLDPRLRMNTKSENLNAKDMIGHSLYLQKFQKAGLFLRSIAFLHSSKIFNDNKMKTENMKKMRNKINETKFSLSEEIVNFVNLKRKSVLHLYGAINDSNVDFTKIKSNPKPKLKEEKEKGLLSSGKKEKDIDFTSIGAFEDNNRNNMNNFNNGNNFNDLNKHTNNGSATTNQSKISNNNEIQKFRSSNNINLNETIDFTAMGLYPNPGLDKGMSISPNITKFNSNNSPGTFKNDNYKFDNNNNSAGKNNPSANNSLGHCREIEKAVSSLQAVDLGNVLSSINFDQIENHDKFGSKEKYNNTNVTNISTNFKDFENTNKNTNDFNLLSTDFLDSLHSNKNRSNTVYQINTVSNPLNSNSNNSNNFNFNNFNNNANVNNNFNANKNIFNMFNFNNILSSNLPQEDRFDPSTINKQLRCSITEKGILLNNKGTYEDVKYRGILALELSNNFQINNKYLYLKASHHLWNDNSFFIKLIPDRNIVEDQKDQRFDYKINCQNVTSTLPRLIEYNINIKIIEPIVDFKVNGDYKEGRYKLAIKYLIKEQFREQMKAAQMVVVIVVKSSDVKILSSTKEGYTVEDRKITFTVKNFSFDSKPIIGVLFETNINEFVEVVKVSYRYMDILPTFNSAELYYFNENNILMPLDVVKKCMVDIRFIP